MTEPVRTPLENETPSLPPLFARYAEVVDDVEAFARAVVRPLPIAAWVNPLRGTREEVADLLANEGYAATPIPGLPLGLRLEARDGARPLATTLAYTLGLFHRQGAVSQIPPYLLAAQPGERVLDLCAAPGGKAAYLAAHVGDSGSVVANDLSGLRLRQVYASALRLGLPSIALREGDAARFVADEPFDAVLADVPCSCEGTSRKHRDALRRRPLATSLAPDAALGGVQAQILLRAVEACRAGGRVVYSTCTYAPEENEAVVSTVLDALGPERIAARPAALPGWTPAPGLTAWDGAAFHPHAAHALRFWPHTHDTGGFFIAVLDVLA